MVRLTRIYTRGGDQGETSLGDGARVPKTAALVCAFGSVDEANATLGLVRLHAAGVEDALLAHIQNDLFDVGADLCVPITSTRTALRMTDAQVAWLEAAIDRLNAGLAPLNSFVLPGGSAAAAYLHMARTVVRRAERDAIAAMAPAAAGPAAVNPVVIRYLNRLSDFLFVLARHMNDRGGSDVLWQPGAHRGTGAAGG